MHEITTQFTEQQLADIGRAMERLGYTTLAEFIAAATMHRTNETLEKQAD